MNIFGIRSARKVVSGSPVVKGIVSPMPVIPSHISRPEYASNATPHSSKDDSSVKIYNPKEYPSLRESGKLARRMLDYAESLAKPGVSTDFIDSMVLKEIIKLGAYPSPVNYYGFPKAICTSVNEVVCHGIPDSRILQEGDMLSIDVSVFYNGYHGDNCGTVIVGEKKREVDVKLIQATREALSKAIGLCKPGTCLSKIGLSIQTVASTYGFNVVHEFCGHGTGKYLHMPPLVYHFANKVQLPLQAGMVFTIEPILVEGSRHIEVWEDKWTAVTEDGGRAAQLEHEILIHEDGAEILTVPN